MSNKLVIPIVAAFALASAFLVIPQVHATTTWKECLNEYAESDASSACKGGTHINIFVGTTTGNCNLADTCPKDDGTYRRTNYTGPSEDLDDLVVCDGVLTKDSCN